MAGRLNSYTSQAARAAGYRSGFELLFAEELGRLGIDYEFEQNRLIYHKPIKKAVCLNCDSDDVVQICEYTPDFYLPDYNVFIETKGRFVSADRTKHVLLKEQFPDVDLRILFEYDGEATPKKSYSEWCEWKGIKYGIVPQKATKKREGIYLPLNWKEEFKQCTS